jgi:hypothetical protein
VSERRQALAVSAQVDRLLAGEPVGHGAAAEEYEIARRLGRMVERLPPIPVELERRVGALVRARAVDKPRRRWERRGWQPAVWSAAATAAVLIALWVVLPLVSPGGGVWAQLRAVLLGQSRVEVTPTLEAGSPPVREPLRDLVAAELLIGRAPSLPKVLPDGYGLQEVTAISYPELPAWISQPLAVELCYGDVSTPCALRLRQYRLLFRDSGGISGVKVASGAVRDAEQVDVQGVTGMRFALDTKAGQRAPTQTIVWERDGLLLELESETLEPDELLEIARSTR